MVEMDCGFITVQAFHRQALNKSLSVTINKDTLYLRSFILQRPNYQDMNKLM